MTEITSRARALYPEEEEGSWFCVSDYDPIIKSFGEVLVQVDDEDYSGDTRVLLRKNDRYGFLIFGWGSCSGCDALQACNNFREVDELIDNLEGGIKWFDTLAEAQLYIANDEEREGSYYCHDKEWKRFKSAALAVTINNN